MRVYERAGWDRFRFFRSTFFLPICVIRAALQSRHFLLLPAPRHGIIFRDHVTGQRHLAWFWYICIYIFFSVGSLLVVLSSLNSTTTTGNIAELKRLSPSSRDVWLCVCVCMRARPPARPFIRVNLCACTRSARASVFVCVCSSTVVVYVCARMFNVLLVRLRDETRCVLSVVLIFPRVSIISIKFVR